VRTFLAERKIFSMVHTISIAEDRDSVRAFLSTGR
jgi:hypothetical protein